VLHAIEYTLLLSWGGVLDLVVGLVSCRVVLLVLKTIFILICLNMLVIFLACGDV
jgi:hypothetical protein